MELYHGSHIGTFTAHEGLCLTDDTDVAERYAARSEVYFAVALDLDALTVEECEGYDHDENEAPADRKAFRAAAAARGVDVLRYEDEDESGNPHTCWRIVSERAISAISATTIEIEE